MDNTQRGPAGLRIPAAVTVVTLTDKVTLHHVKYRQKRLVLNWSKPADAGTPTAAVKPALPYEARVAKCHPRLFLRQACCSSGGESPLKIWALLLLPARASEMVRTTRVTSIQKGAAKLPPSFRRND